MTRTTKLVMLISSVAFFSSQSLARSKFLFVDKTVKVTDPSSGGRVIRYVKPEYPKQLRRKHIQGIVYLRVQVGANGEPKTVQYLEGPRELLPCAEKAVMRWRYSPTVLNGERTEFFTIAAVNFTNSQ